MFAVEASIHSESFAGLPMMERTPAAYAFHRYEKLGVPYEAAAEMAYTAAKRAKNICVKNLQTQHQDLSNSTNVDFHKCEIAQLSSYANVNFSANVDSVHNTMCFARRCDCFTEPVLELQGIKLAHSYLKVCHVHCGGFKTIPSLFGVRTHTGETIRSP